jgi:hypothetical protein
MVENDANVQFFRCLDVMIYHAPYTLVGTQRIVGGNTTIEGPQLTGCTDPVEAHSSPPQSCVVSVINHSFFLSNERSAMFKTLIP